MQRSDDPFESLLRSHRRLEERLADLSQASEAGVELVFDVVGFFERAVTRHEEDEEQSLFPRLSSVPELAPVLASLAAEHRAHRALHAELAALSAPWRDRPPTPGELRALDALAGRLEAAYRAHITEEESVLFPAARRRLDEKTLAEIAAEMDARRPNRGAGGRHHR